MTSVIDCCGVPKPELRNGRMFSSRSCGMTFSSSECSLGSLSEIFSTLIRIASSPSDEDAEDAGGPDEAEGAVGTGTARGIGAGQCVLMTDSTSDMLENSFC